MAELAYQTRSDGVLYELSNGVRAKVQRKSANRVVVSMQRDKMVIPPESGDLDASSFRNKLANLARERFGEVNGLVDELGLIAVGFDAHLQKREEDATKEDKETNDPALVGTPYRIVNGGLVRLKNTREGEIPQRLTNFIARVDEEIVRDDGAEVRRFYRVLGETKDQKLPEAEVPAVQFGSMNWLPEAWGLAARITAGQGARDQTREAIELCSHGAPTRRLYTHTGFRELSGARQVYLHAGGAIGAEEVEVELEPGLEGYGFLALGDTAQEELTEALHYSLKFLEVAPIKVTSPLLAAAYLAPLSEIVVPDFVIWLWAATGSYKSTLAALLLSHYGYFSETNLPLSFESTSNALERYLFLLKDIVAVVDDWRPAVSRTDASEMDRKAQRLLRGVGNRQGRGRMTSDTTLRQSYAPRGLVIATAEALPEGPAFESAAARALSVNLSRDDVDLKKLSELQRNKAMLSKAMIGYIRWLTLQYGTLSRRLPTHRDKLRDRARAELANVHPRTSDTAAALIVGLEMLREYAESVGVLRETEADEFSARCVAGVFEAAKAHTEATKGGDPPTRFVEILRSLFDGGYAYAKDRETGTHPDAWADLGWEQRATQDEEDIIPERNAAFVGWVDESHLYLDKDAAYAAVAGFAQRGGIPFGIKPRALWGALKRAGMTLADAGRSDTTVWVGGRSKRVIQIPRKVIFERASDDS